MCLDVFNSLVRAADEMEKVSICIMGLEAKDPCLVSQRIISGRKNIWTGNIQAGKKFPQKYEKENSWTIWT